MAFTFRALSCEKKCENRGSGAFSCNILELSFYLDKDTIEILDEYDNFIENGQFIKKN